SGDYFHYDSIQDDAHFDPIRDIPAFRAFMSAARPDRNYAAVWRRAPGYNPDQPPRFLPVERHHVDPAAPPTGCLELMAKGFRPISISVVELPGDGALAAASLWQQPVVQVGDRDGLARRRANAAVALARLGSPDEVQRLLEHRPDPSVRSY